MTHTQHYLPQKERVAVQATRKAVRDAFKQTQAKTVLVGLSGGADSLALAVTVAHVAKQLGVKAGAVCVNHNLQEGSAEVTAAAAKQAEELGLNPVLTYSVDVSKYDQGEGPEGIAREARYAAFNEALVLTNADYVLTAHTATDNAEQVLLGLLRGSGTRSLAGIPERNGQVLRPFIHTITRDMTETVCEAVKLPYWSDPQNKDTQYSRVNVRKEIMPFLKSTFSATVEDALMRTAAIATEDADALDTLAETAYSDALRSASPGNASLSIRKLEGMLPALQHRVIRKVAYTYFGALYSRGHVLSVMKLVNNWNGQKTLHLPRSYVRRVGAELKFSQDNVF